MGVQSPLRQHRVNSLARYAEIDRQDFERGAGIEPVRAHFIRDGDGRILLRLWTLSLGGSFSGFGGANNPSYVVRHDLIDLATGGLGDGDDIPP